MSVGCPQVHRPLGRNQLTEAQEGSRARKALKQLHLEKHQEFRSRLVMTAGETEEHSLSAGPGDFLYAEPGQPGPRTMEGNHYVPNMERAWEHDPSRR